MVLNKLSQRIQMSPGLKFAFVQSCISAIVPKLFKNRTLRKQEESAITKNNFWKQNFHNFKMLVRVTAVVFFKWNFNCRIKKKYFTNIIHRYNETLIFIRKLSDIFDIYSNWQWTVDYIKRSLNQFSFHFKWLRKLVHTHTHTLILTCQSSDWFKKIVIQCVDKISDWFLNVSPKKCSSNLSTNYWRKKEEVVKLSWNEKEKK